MQCNEEYFSQKLCNVLLRLFLHWIIQWYFSLFFIFWNESWLQRFLVCHQASCLLLKKVKAKKLAKNITTEKCFDSCATFHFTQSYPSEIPLSLITNKNSYITSYPCEFIIRVFKVCHTDSHFGSMCLLLATFGLLHLTAVPLPCIIKRHVIFTLSKHLTANPL